MYYCGPDAIVNGWLTSVQHAKASQVLEKLSYGYDLVGNVTRRQVETPGREHFSQVYQYDGLHRLVGFDRGKLNAQADGVEQPAGLPFSQSRQWQQLDMLGNWKSTKSTVNGAESTDVRTVNEVNEYVTRQIDAEPQVTLDTDTNGNLVDDGKQVYAYDAENRLISVTRKAGNQLLQTYRYDPLGRRVKTLEPAGAGTETDTTHVYSGGPACLAEYDSLATEGDERLRWFVHGPGFPDPLVMVDESAQGDKAEGVEEVLYYLKDMLGSVVVLTDSNGLVVERYEYDPYGRTEVLTVTYMHDADLDGNIDASDEAHLNACLATEEMQRHPMCVFVHDTDGDGIVDLDDLSVFEGFDYSSNGPRPPAEWERAPTSFYDANNDKNVEMFDFYGFQVCFASTNSLCHYVFDANNDSQVTLADYTAFLASYQRTAPTRTATTGASRFGNPFMWTGQRYDAAVGLYHFVFRSYSPELGRWLQRDPLGYVDSANLLEYVMSQPTFWIDPFGLTSPRGGIADDVDEYIDDYTEHYEDGIDTIAAVAALIVEVSELGTELIAIALEMGYELGKDGLITAGLVLIPIPGDEIASLAKMVQSAQRLLDRAISSVKHKHRIDKIKKILKALKKLQKKQDKLIRKIDRKIKSDTEFSRWFHKRKGKEKIPGVDRHNPDTESLLRSGH